MRHGQLTDNGSNRWCEVCGHKHGCLYLCRHYDKRTLMTILAKQDQWRTLVWDPEWVARQGPIVAAIYQFFAGPPLD